MNVWVCQQPQDCEKLTIPPPTEYCGDPGQLFQVLWPLGLTDNQESMPTDWSLLPSCNVTEYYPVIYTAHTSAKWHMWGSMKLYQGGRQYWIQGIWLAKHSYPTLRSDGFRLTRLIHHLTQTKQQCHQHKHYSYELIGKSRKAILTEHLSVWCFAKSISWSHLTNLHVYFRNKYMGVHLQEASNSVLCMITR